MPHADRRQITLSDNRVLAYAEYGSPSGVPVVYCHGAPSSQVEAALVLNPALLNALGVRVIVPDRPGVGGSSPKPNRVLNDWPADVGELASNLGLDTFAVMGSSGGAPYALACGAALGERVRAVGIVGGVAPLDVPGMLAQFSRPLRVMFRLGRSAPMLLRALFRLNLRMIRRGGERAGKRMAAMVPEPDRPLFERPEVQAGWMACFVEACRQGVDGPAADLAVIARPWALDIASIKIPVLVWHGVRDGNVPVACGRYFANSIPRCHATFYADDAHLSVPINHQEEIFSALLAAGWRTTGPRSQCPESRHPDLVD